MKVRIEPWQISEITTQSIHLPVAFGLEQKGTVSIPARLLDQNEDGSFTAYFKKKTISILSIQTSQQIIASSKGALW